MITQIKTGILKYFQQETLAERIHRMLAGAIYCEIAATVYILVSSVINVIFFPGLHLAVYWIGLLTTWIEVGIALALAGAIVGWFTEDHEGIVWGGVVLAVLIFIGNLVVALISGRSATLMGQSIFLTAIPLIGAGILVAWVIRMAIKRHVQANQQKMAGDRRKQLVQLTLLVILVGLIVGVFSLFGTSSLSTLRSMNTTLQNYATDNLIDKRFPYDKVPALKSHFGMNYSLYVHLSTIMTGSMDITIHFEDGYNVTCLVPQLETNSQMLLDTCNEGTQVSSP
jgi:MFS family permease